MAKIIKNPIRVGAYAAIVKNNKILLVEFNDKSGRHFNLPGGGIDSGESVAETLRREVLEETKADIHVGNLILVWEYEPIRNKRRFGARHKLGLVFRCDLNEDSTPAMPEKPDKNQVAVRWLRLEDLPQVPLLPAIAADIITALSLPKTDIRYWSEGEQGVTPIASVTAKTPVKKATVKKTPAKKTPVKKATPKKSSVKKTVVKKKKSVKPENEKINTANKPKKSKKTNL